MMQLTELTNDEIKYICGQIPVSVVRTYFQKNPREFTEIKKGFRPDKITDAETVSLLTRNISKPFITSFVEKTLDKWIEEIDEYKTGLINEGYSEGEALLKTIPDSYFCDDCELYFKLKEIQVSSEYMGLFKDALSIIDKTVEDREDTQTIKNQAATIENNEDEIAKLKEQLKNKEEKLELAKNNLAEVNDALSESKNELQVLKKTAESVSKELSEAEASISAMRPELEKYKYLVSNADSDYEDEKRYQHISIGTISHDMSGQIWINRLADIIEGEIIPFRSDDYIPKLFDNRDRLFWKDGPDENGNIGVWGWRADPRDTDPSKDYVVSEFQKFARVTEIIEFQNCHTVSDITKIITEKFELGASSKKILLTCTTANGLKEGLLCNYSDFEIIGGEARLLPSVFTLRKYAFKDSDCIQIADKRVFRFINLGTPQGIVRPRTPFEVIKKLLLNRISVPMLREKGLTKKEAQKCLGYLKEIPEDTIVEEFMDVYDCNESEAKEYVNSFIEHAESYLADDDFDLNVLSAALERNTELVLKCKEVLKEEWEAEYSETINDLNSKLKEVENLVKENEDNCAQLEQKKEDLIHEIEEKEKLAIDVESRISKRIIDAKKNAADFISQMAFIAPLSTATDHFADSVSERIVRYSSNDYSDCGEIDDVDSFEEELVGNLIIVGYDESASIEMAQAIRFCISNKTPLVVSENSNVIADCVAGVLGRKRVKEYYIPMSSGSNTDVLSAMTTNIEELDVVLVHGVFDGYSNNIFNAIVNMLINQNETGLTIISIQGLDSKMLPKDVWNHAFYIDGDDNLCDYQKEKLNAYTLKVGLDFSIDNNHFSEARKELAVFNKIICNTAKNNYSKYLSLYELSVGTSWFIQLQIKTIARSLKMEDELSEIYRNNGINEIDVAG